MDLLGGEDLSEDRREMLSAHLARCPECRSFEEEISGMLKTLQQTEMPPLPDVFFEGIRDSVLDAFEKPAPARMPFREWVSRFRWPSVLVPSLSGAMGIAIGFFVATAWLPRDGIQPGSTAFQPAGRKTVAAILPGRQAATSAALASDEDSQTIDTLELYAGSGDILDTVGEEGASEVLKDWENDVPAEVYDLIAS